MTQKDMSMLKYDVENGIKTAAMKLNKSITFTNPVIHENCIQWALYCDLWNFFIEVDYKVVDGELIAEMVSLHYYNTVDGGYYELIAAIVIRENGKIQDYVRSVLDFSE